MSNKIALITGPTSGIGYVTAIELSKHGFDLILVARNEKKVRELQNMIGDRVRTDYVSCDLGNIASVLNAVAEIKTRYFKIDVLINNAGLIVQNKQFSADGIELTFVTNHLGPFVLTTGLINLLKATDKARIIHVSSEAHFFAFFDINKLVNPSWYQDLVVYGRSKLANILFSNELSDRLQLHGITSNALHPGTVASNFAGNGTGISTFFMKFFRPFFKTVEQGAATTIYLATSPEVEGVSGQYFVDSKPGRSSKAAKDRELGSRLWDLSEELTRFEDQPTG
ncbi:Short-chain dehydrogenase [Dyadobacter koreensis]|uniref:Short-chain dehydrogenase n=1 Tax=Dyadobacter koreensis TaxID=408657 RepID=A0A1H6VQR9_9BACT|nr:SDR family oxidoreductase [Dyadobacter koreensis]SEJ02572.1 Short-chain dehydrogenase [Dyadobacter koreensis]